MAGARLRVSREFDYNPGVLAIRLVGNCQISVKLPVRTIHELDSNQKNPFRIWVDADACPSVIRDILFRTGKRLGIEVILVANQSIWVPTSDLIRIITVRDGADIADNTIVEQMRAGDVVVTSDIPLAARVVEKGGIAIGTRGEVFDDVSVHGRLASRNVMEHLRSAGVDTSGPRPLSQKDAQTFANALDRSLTRISGKAGGRG